MDSSMENLALGMAKMERLFIEYKAKSWVLLLALLLLSVGADAQNTTAVVNVPGLYYEHNFVNKNRIIIQRGSVLNNVTINGYVFIDTDEKVVLNNCDIYSDSEQERDFLLCINKENGNVELNHCKIHCENFSVRYGLYTPRQVKSLCVRNCEFYGLSETAINCSNRVVSANIEANYIHDIGTYKLKDGKYHKNSTGIRIYGNLDDVKPDYSLYDGMSISIRNNNIRNLISYYVDDNDAIESHGIIVYGNNVCIDSNTIEDLLAGKSADDLSIYSGSEHEGIYVKGDHCLITNNVLRNACGNYGSEGSIAVKWNGLGGRIVNNKIYQCFGNGIWSQCRGVDISNNQIHYMAPPVLDDKKIDRFYGIYNYVVTKNYIPIYKATKHTSNIKRNNISYVGVDNLRGYVVSIDNNIDDINICNNSISVDGFVQLFRLVEQGTGKGVKRTVTIQGNYIEKPFPVRNDYFVQQDFMIGCGNDQQSILTLSIADNEIRYRRVEKPYMHIGLVLRNYRCDENIHILMKNNTMSLPQYIPQTCFRIEDGVRLLDISNNKIDTHLRRLVEVCNTERECDIIIKKNQFGANIGVIQLSEGAKIKNIKFCNNRGEQDAEVTLLPDLSTNFADSYFGNLYVKGNRFKSMIISEKDDYKTLLKGKAIIKNNHF